jgi:hypothetical protein
LGIVVDSGGLSFEGEYTGDGFLAQPHSPLETVPPQP